VLELEQLANELEQQHFGARRGEDVNEITLL
jgi:hypothetical protein